jgi:hypothetical protein
MRSSLDASATVSVFLVLCWLPLVVSLALRDADVSLSEQRTLAALPEVAPAFGSLPWLPSLAWFDALPEALERYYDDRVGLRDDMIRAWAWLHLELLDISPSPSLIVGKRGWLFFGDANAVAQYRGTVRFDEAELDEWMRVLRERRDWLAARGTPYLLVLVPNKHRIYGRYMPDALNRVRDESHLDQLAARLAEAGDVAFVDLREPLAEAARAQRIYHKTDTHWNDLGAWTAYLAILERLGRELPALAGRPPVEVRPLVRTTPGGGLARIVGLSLARPEDSFDLVVVDPRGEAPPHRRRALDERIRKRLPFALGTGDPGQPTAVVFRDSFADALIPFLSESFSRVVYAWERDVDPRIVESENPDVVIQEIAERFLDRTPRSLEEARRTPAGATTP